MGKDDYDIGVSHANLTGYYNSRKDFSKAYYHVCKTVEIWEKCLEHNHPNLLQALEIKDILEKII